MGSRGLSPHRLLASFGNRTFSRSPVVLEFELSPK
jgi:hypothetical protein